MQTTEFLHLRIEAMEKRIAELESENAALKALAGPEIDKLTSPMFKLSPDKMKQQVEEFKRMASAVPSPLGLKIIGRGINHSFTQFTKLPQEEINFQNQNR